MPCSSMQSINIRIATLHDKKVLMNVGWQTFFDTFHQQNTREDMQLFLETNFTIEAIISEMENSCNTFLLAYIGKEVAGYCKLSEQQPPGTLQDKDVIEISRLYAVKEKIGSGVGKALMNYCLELAAAKKKETIWLGVWENNQRAIQFYRRFGFEKFGEHPFLLGNDIQNDWLMKKDLQSD